MYIPSHRDVCLVSTTNLKHVSFILFVFLSVFLYFVLCFGLIVLFFIVCLFVFLGGISRSWRMKDKLFHSGIYWWFLVRQALRFISIVYSSSCVNQNYFPPSVGVGAGFKPMISIAPNWAPRLRRPTLELSTLGCSSTNNSTLHVLQRTIGPYTSVCRHCNPRECSWNTAQLTLSNDNQSIHQRNIALIRCLLFCIMIL
jgi:hypothetical protein